MSPLVTAVITTCARPHHVREALASVCAETYEEIECVVVDDGGTFELPGAGLTRDVRVLRSDRRGVAHARNLGLAAARGEFVIFLDDDDVAMPHRIATLVEAAQRHRAELCFGMTRRVSAGSPVELASVPTHARSFDAVGLCDVIACAPHVNSVLVRTALLRAVGGFDLEASHFDDWSAWIRLADQKIRMYRVGDVVAEWRLHGEGLSAGVLHLGVMKARLLALFDHLKDRLSAEGARAIALARDVVAGSEVDTYDDYANAMHAARERDGVGAAPGRNSDLVTAQAWTLRRRRDL